MVDHVETDRWLLDQAGLPHRLQDWAIDPVLVAPVSYDQVGIGDQVANGLLRGRVRGNNDLYLVPTLEQVAHRPELPGLAVLAQVPALLPLVIGRAQEHGWQVGTPFLIRYCRVGVMNDLGDLLDPAVVVLLIGERPGLATAESLSAYMAYRPRPGDTDAKRNLIANIHARGVSPADAAGRIVNLAAEMMARKESGVGVKENLMLLQ